ncbi:MAG: hypothetical protein COA44_09390 [Arcobacter sp.]|nr:MAG: hypothetical protein COA44_09390 [Arcobacter sp.]
MKYFIYFIFSMTLVFGAGVNKKLYSENNVSHEIQRLRLLIGDNTSTDVQEQNKISIKKLFLTKIETLSLKSSADSIKSYKLPKQKKLSQKEFLKYFDDVAVHLNNKHNYEKNKEVLHKRLVSIQDHLSSLEPNEKDEIMQSQLQYAYFKWKEIINKRKLSQYKSYLQAEKEPFKKAFLKTQINVKDLEKKTDKQNVKLQNLYQSKVYLELRLEKETILVASNKVVEDDLNATSILENLSDTDKNWKYNFVLKELNMVNMKISSAIKVKNNTLILRQIKNLQDENLASYIIVRDIMGSFSADLTPKDKEMFELEMKMLEWLKYEHIGDITAFWYDFEAWSDNVYDQALTIVNTPLFYKHDKPVLFSDFLKMFFTIFLGFMLAKFYKKRVNAAQKRITFIQKQSFKIIGNIGYYIIVLVTIAISLNNIGLDLSSLSLVAGALSVGIGFGLKEVVGNFVSGIILMVERSVKIGDFVEIEGDISGNVIDIRMRSVTIKTSSNVDVVVPNSSLVQHSFTNYTLEEPVRRLSVPFTVAYGVSYEEVNDIILDALEKSTLHHIRNSKEFETEVIMSGMDERGVNYTLFVFVNTYGPNARSSFFRLVYKSLLAHKLPIPAPHLEVNISKEIV